MKVLIDVLAILIIITLVIWVYVLLFGKDRHNCRIKLPSSCIMIPPASINLIDCLRMMLKTNKAQVYLDLGDVKDFNFESYIVIMAQSEKLIERGKKVFLCADTPLSRMVRKTLMTPKLGSSTYHQHLTGFSTIFIKQSDLSIPSLVKVEKDLKRLDIRDYYGLNTMITEIIGNALEHGIRDRNINWWMHHYVEKGVMKIVFVDMGLGILSSYRNAGLGRNIDDGQLILGCLNGNLGSSTREKHRGRGLPQIDKMARNNFISDFVLTTNGITLRFINNEYVLVRHGNFEGTYYSWTVNKDNFLQWRTSIK